MKWCFRFLKRLVSLPHTMLLRLWQAVFSLCLLLWMSMQPALADLPQMEPPSSGGGSGLFGQIKGYSQDGVVLGGLDYLRHWVYCRGEFRNFHVCGSPERTKNLDGVWGHCGGGGDPAGCGDLAADQIGFHHSVRNTPMQTIHFYPIALMWSRASVPGLHHAELGLVALSGAALGLLWWSTAASAGRAG